MPSKAKPVVITKIKEGELFAQQVDAGAFSPTKVPKDGIIVKHYGSSIYIPKDQLQKFLKNKKKELKIDV